MKHISVMLEETIALLNVKPDGIYVDATLGAGGHSYEICKQLTTGRLIGFDKDFDAIERTKKRLAEFGDTVTYVQGSYTQLTEKLDELGITEVDGVLFDLGVSSPQFDDPERGFSYRFDARLDMRMDQTQALSAYEVVNNYSEEDLIRILKEHSEERYAHAIVKHILRRRPVTTTFELVECIKAAYPAKELKKGHPAKKTFQALRIEVNNEFAEAKDAVDQAVNLIKVGGRVVVITFHSIEDRIVKTIFNNYGKPAKVNPRIPVVQEEILHYKLISKGTKASKWELEDNNRAHSAILRGIERVV
ncbi:16S rRNA (cytosine(1402)-N(4))-methyltransferase RsmH [Erysipelothrix sp. HDW6C]|uniref:16S rRNA (cytosine(1402)-N(4))-methyltransferase RsmH n=1 Tax=Erysipelothrix sp. HDW6C TaxID=2714930 RepID=UPI001407FF11|nr:16S rRNA (cytosine(1402)-N(4))-methyltransferase RsmH [Erysipelothrix sp. HDW6C]QIK70374.1 16S rRNA (cytosine(1402)-N(4))-methyltransferase RsmH [Erysipelothrix sp. HDW6C]